MCGKNNTAFSHILHKRLHFSELPAVIFMNPTTFSELFLFSPQKDYAVELLCFLTYIFSYLFLAKNKITYDFYSWNLHFIKFGRQHSSSDSGHFSASNVRFKFVLKERKKEKCQTQYNYVPVPSTHLCSPFTSTHLLWVTETAVEAAGEECCSVEWHNGTFVRKLPPEAVLEVTILGVCHQTAKAYLKYGQFADILGHFDIIVPVSQHRESIG